jgi:hypothetical protein
MSQNNNNDNNSGNSGKTSFGIKAGYIGTGILIGLVIYPFVRKTLATMQPKLDKFFDDLTGKAEGMAEKASDIMAKAKENIFKSDKNIEKHDHPDH